MRNRRIGLRSAALAAALSGCLGLLTAGSASAATTTIGQNGAGGAGTTGPGTFVQTATGKGVPSYVVPAGGGVITSWSFRAGSTPDERDRLKVVRRTATANEFFVVGQGALETMTPSTLNTFLVRIPVRAGDFLGLYTADGNDSTVPTTNPDNTDAYIANTDPPPNTTFTGTPENSSGEAYNVSATVEPDADHDGWGDGTQDKCVGVTGSVQGCPKADLSITKTASARTVLRGRSVTYTLRAKNHGPDPAPNAVVKDALASGASLESVSASASGVSCTGTSIVRCNVGTLASGATTTVTLKVRMAGVGSKTDTATVSSATLEQAARNASGAGDTTSANNSASTTTTVAGLSNATESHKRWREPSNPKLATFSRTAPPIGTTFGFRLGEPARVRFDFTQRVPGRSVNGICVARTNGNTGNRKCTRTVARGSFSFAGHGGLNTVTFQGRISPSKKLKPGKYVVAITAHTPGVGSTLTRLTFTIVR